MTDNNNGWTPERRAAQRQRMLELKAWEKSTGPRSRKGKANSAQNARKHGETSKQAKLLRDLQKQKREGLPYPLWLKVSETESELKDLLAVLNAAAENRRQKRLNEVKEKQVFPETD